MLIKLFTVCRYTPSCARSLECSRYLLGNSFTLIPAGLFEGLDEVKFV